ncbi:pseudouridine synthase [Naematelia encephala]|uniref:Pseudouridine synthase n=1 Tax=Naematelia encephala TaxID=71784 RepID=A0A1Y2B981_9TREE|nr:pseudouridine synthase [Naematelia encephala]
MAVPVDSQLPPLAAPVPLSSPSSSSSSSTRTPTNKQYPNGKHPMLRYQTPYWWPYRTFVKKRWIGRELLEVVSTEFRDRSVEYYRHALESGVTRVNGAVAWPELVLRDGDRIDNTVHRHEPPITNDPILILHIDREREFVVISKPGSIPVHVTGRYFRHTVLEIMKSDHDITCYSVNRLDRLTSGLMILALTSGASRDLSQEFVDGKVQKEYVARVRGRFPDGEITVDQPLLTVDRQMGLVIVTPEGKEAKTIFKRMSYDPKRDESVVHCRPMTGRTHQIRVHLQYLGHSIPNDPLYAQEAVWGPGIGRGGVKLAEPGESSASALATAIAARIVKNGGSQNGAAKKDFADPSDNNREYANIDIASPIRLSSQAKDIIAKLRRQKDEQEDWVKWKEVVFNIKTAQDSLETTDPTPPPTRSSIPHPRTVQSQIKAGLPDALPDETPSPLKPPAHLPEGFCKECFIPVPDDPNPETQFIYLHALRYTTEGLGQWETPLPRWAGADWDGEDWRGWVDVPDKSPEQIIA